MDAMADKIGAILRDPESVAQLQSLASMLGVNAPDAAPAAESAAAAPSAPPAPAAGAAAIPPEMMQGMLKLAPVLRDLHRETPDTGLLRALRPLLSAPRQKKLDDAIRIVQLLNILPELQASGVLRGLLG